MTENPVDCPTQKSKRSSYYPESSKKYYARPEIQEKKKEYEKVYRDRPEFKEMKKEYNKRYQERLKLRRLQEKQLLEQLLAKEDLLANKPKTD